MSEPCDKRLERAIADLPGRREPAVDLWPGIEARLAPRRRWAVPTSAAAALAAGLALAVWLGRTGTGPVSGPATGTPATVAQAPAPLLRQAALVDRSYRAALLAPRAAPANLGPAERRALAAELATLDDAQARIRSAMETQPDGEYLLSLLAQTHALRLDLVNRLAGGPADNTGEQHENGNV